MSESSFSFGYFESIILWKDNIEEWELEISLLIYLTEYDTARKCIFNEWKDFCMKGHSSA